MVLTFLLGLAGAAGCMTEIDGDELEGDELEEVYGVGANRLANSGFEGAVVNDRCPVPDWQDCFDPANPDAGKPGAWRLGGTPDLGFALRSAPAGRPHEDGSSQFGLRLVGVPNADFAYASQVVRVTPGIHRLRAYVKLAEKSDYHGTGIIVGLWNDTGPVPDGLHVVNGQYLAWLAPDLTRTDWQKRMLDLEIPPGTKYAQIVIANWDHEPRVAHWDDIVFAPIDPY